MMEGYLVDARLTLARMELDRDRPHDALRQLGFLRPGEQPAALFQQRQLEQVRGIALLRVGMAEEGGKALARAASLDEREAMSLSPSEKLTRAAGVAPLYAALSQLEWEQHGSAVRSLLIWERYLSASSNKILSEQDITSLLRMRSRQRWCLPRLVTASWHG